ncbi:MAG: ABC transporter permease, partial [Pseudomonadota bacterium]
RVARIAMLKRILAIFHARNLEFIRDRSSFAWNIIMPVALVFGMALIFSGEDRTQFTVGVLDADTLTRHAFAETRFINFVSYDNEQTAFDRLSRHSLDLIVRDAKPLQYWVNPESPQGYIVERLLLASDNGSAVRNVVSGDAVRYVDWLLPGILGMNMMFSCLFGVGYVVVRYRKNGFLKRLKATPLRALEFVIAQVASRLLLILILTSAVYTALSMTLGTRMEGSYLALFLIALVGCIALISLGLMVAARVTSEELAGGLLNLLTWPMMLLSGVWFSLEGSAAWIQQVAQASPLTQMLTAARSIMLDGAGLADVLPQLVWLVAMSVVFMAMGAWLFRWRQD